MPVVVGGTYVSPLPGVPTPADSDSVFPGNFNYFAVSLAQMVVQVNRRLDSLAATLGFHADLTVSLDPPATTNANFASSGDTFLATFPTLRTQVNGVIDLLYLSCPHVSALPPIPSRTADPLGFFTKVPAFLAALPTFRTELNAFITALNNFVSLPVFATRGESAAAGDAYSATVVSGGDPSFSSVKLLLGFNGANGSTSFTDESPSPHSLTAFGNAQISTANQVFGTGSGLFDGSGDYITAADTDDWNIGVNGFTLEMFVRFQGKQNSQGIIGQWDNGGAYPNIGFGLYIGSGQLTFLLPYTNYVGGTNKSATDVAYNFVPTLGQWYHVAVDMAAPTGAGPQKTMYPVRLYVDGVMRSKSANNDAYGGYGFPNSSQPISIGRLGTAATSYAAYDFSGNLDEIRLTTGAARYNSDSGFTVPSSAYPRS